MAARFTNTLLNVFWRDSRYSADVSWSRQSQSQCLRQKIIVDHTKRESVWCATVLGGTLRSCADQVIILFCLTSPQEGSLLEASPLLWSAADTILHCPLSPLTAYMTYFHNINTPTRVDYCITTLQISSEPAVLLFYNRDSKEPEPQTEGMKKQLFKDGERCPRSNIPRPNSSAGMVAMEMALGEDN